jgi:hypothetical protein
MNPWLCSAALGALSCLLCGGAAPPDSPRLMVSLRRSDDKAEVGRDGDRVTVVVRCPFGVSQAVLERQDDAWPGQVVLRLHLKGLSHFQAANGTVTLHAAADVRDGRPEVRQWKDRAEDRPLNDRSPYWMAVRVVGADGKPARQIPLKGGYFEVTLPRAFLKANPKSVTASWVDFYR